MAGSSIQPPKPSALPLSLDSGKAQVPDLVSSFSELDELPAETQLTELKRAQIQLEKYLALTD